MLNSTFSDDISMGIGDQNFSGNAGGVAIGYQPEISEEQSYQPNVTISGCDFTNNQALATDNKTFTFLEVLSSKIYNQRGGGVAFYFGRRKYNGTVLIQNCHFINNTAADSGGGVYMFLNGVESSHNITSVDTDFVGNKAQDGGGLEITHSNEDSVNNPNFVSVINCTFFGNRGKFGGGYKNIQLNDYSNSNNLVVEDTVFDGNEAEVGAGIYLQSVESVRDITLLRRISMKSW